MRNDLTSELDRQVRDRPDWVSHDLFPFTSRFVELDGNSVHYVDEGDGPVLLFLHGNPVWSFVYRDVIRELADEFRCVALDLPGFGLSSAAPGYEYLPHEHAAVVEAFVGALELSDITLMVNDWGGPIGLSVAAAHSDRFSRLIVANSWAWPIAGDPHFERFSAVMGGSLGRFLVTRVRPFIKVLISKGHARRRLSDAEMAHYRGPFPTPESRLPAIVLIRAIKEAGPWLGTVEQGLSRLADRPVLLLWGDRDPAFRSSERERFERLFPHTETVHLRGAGNFVAADAPEEVAAAIRAWHRKTAAR